MAPTCPVDFRVDPLVEPTPVNCIKRLSTAVLNLLRAIVAREYSTDCFALKCLRAGCFRCTRCREQSASFGGTKFAEGTVNSELASVQFFDHLLGSVVGDVLGAVILLTAHADFAADNIPRSWIPLGNRM
jgi:hypothetical protein